MSKKAPEVSGTVQNDDGKHLTGATVVLLPDEQHRDQFESYPSGTTDQYGAFTVKNVRPGKYKVLAWEELEGSEYMIPNSPNRLRARRSACRSMKAPKRRCNSPPFRRTPVRGKKKIANLRVG